MKLDDDPPLVPQRRSRCYMISHDIAYRMSMDVLCPMFIFGKTVFPVDETSILLIPINLSAKSETVSGGLCLGLHFVFFFNG